MGVDSAIFENQGEGLKGLLISLLTIFDVDGTRNLTKDEYVQAAGPLGIDVSDSAWAALCVRFGNESTKKRPTTAPEDQESVDTSLDLTLLGAYFSNKYDSVLEEGAVQDGL
jgi:hypothetical protein